jgi:glycosyltransferase involved in cell wall biosynthesis
MTDQSELTPKVSVVMPVRDGARWLHDALDSVIAQTMTDWELLAIDDGSSDDTPKILAEFAQRDRRIRNIRQSPLGLVAALNRGLADARAPLLARLDADDRALAQRLERQVDHLAAHPEIGLLGTWAVAIDGSGRRHSQLRPATQPDELVHILERGNPFVHSSVMFRTAFVRSVGGYRAAFRAAEDYDLFLRISEKTKVANLPEPLVEYRRHSENVTSRNAIRQAFSARLARRCARLRREAGIDPADGMSVSPDWRNVSASPSFFADDAALYRVLDLADPDLAAANANSADFSLLATRFSELNHAERTLAALAMINGMTSADTTQSRKIRALFLRLLRRRPGMIPRGAFGALPRALLR